MSYWDINNYLPLNKNTKMITSILLTTLYIMVIVAIFILIIYLFEKFVRPIDATIKGVLIFVLVAALIIYAITNHGLNLL